MDSRQEFTVQEEDFYKCGDAIISRDQTMFALSSYCKAIFMELTTFVAHIIWKHQPDLSLNDKCVYGAKENAVFKEEYAMDEVISDPVILENKETLASEGEFIEGVIAEGNPYDNDEHHIIDDGNLRQEIEELELYYADRSPSIKEQFKASLEEKYNKYPELWNSNHSQYNNKVLRIKTMKYITKLMQMEYPRKNIALSRIQVQLRKKQNKFAEHLGYKWHNKNKDISKQNTKRNNEEESHEVENYEKDYKDNY